MTPIDWSYKTDADQEAAEDAEIDRVARDGLTIKVPLNVAILLVAEACSDDRTPEYVATRIIRRWGDKRTAEAFALEAAFRASEAARSAPEPSRGQTERDFENELADQLRALGLTVSTQVNTDAGVADIVVYSDDKPYGVVEVKLAFRSWRAAHQAFGQAKAYAGALKAKRAWVTAPVTDNKLFSRKAPHILEWASAAATIHKSLGALTVVQA